MVVVGEASVVVGGACMGRGQGGGRGHQAVAPDLAGHGAGVYALIGREERAELGSYVWLDLLECTIYDNDDQYI